MILCFALSMPNVGSWNGKWTGASDYRAVTRSFRGKEREAQAEKILAEGYYRYEFGDGWCAGISVIKVDSAESRKVNHKSIGFGGYEWMVAEIIKHGRILTLQERAKAREESNG